MTRISALLGLRATMDPHGVALIGASGGDSSGGGGGRFRWRELVAATDGWAETFRYAGLLPGARLGLQVGDPVEFAAAYLGVLAAGITAVPLDPRATETETARSVAILRCDALVTDREGPLELVPLVVDDQRPRAMVGAHPAVLLTSSGTTGTPKGIGLDERQLLDAAARVARHHRITSADIGYSPLPLFHINAQVVGVLTGLVSGATLVLDRRFDAERYWATVAEHRATWLNAVPALLAALAERPGPSAPATHRVRFVRSASAPLPVATLRAFETRTGLRVLETYGMTEAAGQITANPLDERLRRPGSVGRPVGMALSVRGPDGGELPRDEPGMVALRGRAVVHHYRDIGPDGAERLRPARDGQGWLRTGDLGVVDPDGFVHLLGRVDDVINRGGEKVLPGDVEAVVLADPAVREAAVVGVPDDRLGEVPVAYITVRAGTEDPGRVVRQVMDACTARLSRYKRPVAVHIVDELPLGPTGKVLRRRLRGGLVGAR
ncbi:MAG: class I adenylate-forming enzyme family protein [Actinomycetes bacterium]